MSSAVHYIQICPSDWPMSQIVDFNGQEEAFWTFPHDELVTNPAHLNSSSITYWCILKLCTRSSGPADPMHIPPQRLSISSKVRGNDIPGCADSLSLDGEMDAIYQSRNHAYLKFPSWVEDKVNYYAGWGTGITMACKIHFL